MELTRKQKQLLDVERITGGSVNVICGSVIFDTVFDVKSMSKAVNELFKINDALRIRLVDDGFIPSQKVFDFKERDIEILKFSERTEVSEFAVKYTQIPIDIYDSLCEIKIILSECFSGIIYKLHHIIADAWTLALLATQFNRIINGEEVVAYSYCEHIYSDNKYILSKRYVNDKEFYIEQFRKQSEPAFISSKETNGTAAKRVSFSFSKKIVDSLRLFVEKKKISSAIFFLTIMSIYFSRTNNIEQFYIGVPIINRSGQVEKNTAGLFVNTAPTLISLDNQASVSDNIEKVEESFMSTMRHQKFTYEDVLMCLDNEFGFKGSLFDVLFSYQNAQIYGECFESEWYHNGMQNESLQIHIDARDDTNELKIHYDYQVGKFAEKDIEKLHNNLCNLILDALENPDKIISDLEMLSSDEKNKLICEFNDTIHNYDIPDCSTICSLFEKTARENKEKICIKTSENEVNFGEVLNTSEQVDCAIRKITGGRKSVIAVIAERSVEMYAAIYGIIRGGNAYLPIDPDYPEERISYILADSDASAVAVQNKFIHLVRNKPCVNVTGLLENSVESIEKIPECNVVADDTAYVIYTSGSTGNPKGAKISHRSAVNRILWMHDRYPLAADDVILQKTPYTFDVSVWEHFWWGMRGGCLVVSKPGEHFLPAKILEEVHKNKVTHLHFVPSVFELFLNYLESHKDEQGKFNSVRYVFLSGEVLSASLVQRFYRIYDYSKVTLHNLYGPTECAVDVTYYDCCPSDIDPVPIGKPIYNTKMYVVDKQLNPMPVGITGELCIAGTNVGQGYLNNPKLTAEKFVDNPFGEGKLYKTGDLAYWREDGNIVFCGRKDGQIKLNGQRIEIGEIESVIASFDGVESVAVIVKSLAPRDTLVAYYTGRRGNEETIRRFCMDKLPRYMVPGAVVHMDKLPLNQSGKLDRKKLAQLQTEVVQNTENELPVNDTENFICNVFKSVLGAENIGRNSDFFELGGTSLLMISLLSEKGFENITASEFMRNPTPVGLSLVLIEKKRNRFEYLEPLYVSENPEHIMILIPFAGGGVEAYSSFVNLYKRENSRASVYFVRYLHSSEECEKAAGEIASSFKNKQILFYSHCVGSALALQMISLLEKSGVQVEHYFAAASIPPSKPLGKSIWRKVSDGVIKAILMKAGAQLDSLSEEGLAELLSRFRADTDYANISYYQLTERIKTPTSVIISKKDIFTKNYKHAEKLWGKYVQTIKGVSYIDSKSHYFQSDDSEKLIKILGMTI